MPRATPQPAIHAETFRELDRRSLAHDAAEQLKSLISEGVLSPGDKLPAERVLSARLGVSRPTLREAVRGLVIMGLLESRHGAGTFVAHGVGAASGTVSVTIDLEDPLDSLFELRLLLEPVMAERAAAHITDAVVRELRRLLETMESRVSEPEAFLQLDADFHRVIHVAAESRFMLSILDAIAEPAIRGRRLSSRRPGVTRRTLTEHEIILDALERRDPFEARAAMTAHLVHIRAELIGQTT